MYKEVTDFDGLKALVKKDKASAGADTSTRNRYPIRLLLLDNFRDCSDFVDFVRDELKTMVYSVEKWLDPNYPDIMLTHTQLADNIRKQIDKANGKDCVIVLFSELARFYDNNENKTFEALLRTIKAIEATWEAAVNHQRIYVLIVGLEGKMEAFSNDSQSFIWRLKRPNNSFSYRLILTDGETFNVRGLETHYTIVNNMHEWLSLWRDESRQENPNIVCTSHSIYANAGYAQPDHAFSYIICPDAYTFLTQGLRLNFGGMCYHEDEKDMWELLASYIDVTSDFDFKDYVLNYFHTSEISTIEAFMKLWLENNGKYERWLLANLGKKALGDTNYVSRMLDKTLSYTGNGLLEQMAMELSENDNDILERRTCLMMAAQKHISIRDSVASVTTKRLQMLHNKYNATSVLKYFTGITEQEKMLAVVWLGRGQITKEQVKTFFPDLYYYLSEPVGIVCDPWISKYMDSYKQAKVCNEYTEEVKNQIGTLNASAADFNSWYQDFSTVRTLLKNRGDIELFYWIDGLGIDWIPLIKHIINEKSNDNIFLNEVKIARALLPTKTSVNRPDLEKMLPEGKTLPKSGDLDSLAHRPTNTYPNTIVDEIKQVRDIVEDILSKYNGKKIAIVSDHGLTYLSQLCDGLGLKGVESDHHGRIAIKEHGQWTMDSNYIVLEDDKTACALRHKSLCAKVPRGQGCHGGCTPEEVLVPIFIISSSVTGVNWTAELLTTEISGANPTFQFVINELPSTEIPYIVYDGTRYELHNTEDDIYESDPVIINEKACEVQLVIGSKLYIKNVAVLTGAKEEDLFSDF
jgi:hypothetical protein